MNCSEKARTGLRKGVMKGYLPGGLPGPLMGKPGRGSYAQRKAAFNRAVKRRRKNSLKKTINAVSK